MFYATRDLVLKPPKHILLSRYVAEATTSSDCIADPSRVLYHRGASLSTDLLRRGRCIPCMMNINKLIITREAWDAGPGGEHKVRPYTRPHPVEANLVFALGSRRCGDYFVNLHNAGVLAPLRNDIV
jgi:hypothetical protein